MTHLDRRLVVLGLAARLRRQFHARRVRRRQDQAGRGVGADRGRCAELLPAGRQPRREGRRQDHPGDQPPRQGLRERGDDAGLAHAAATSRSRRAMPARSRSSSALPYGDQVLWPDHCVQGTESAELSKDLKIAACAAHHPQGLPQRRRQLLGVPRGRQEDQHRLASYLKERGITTIFVTGLATDFCVAWSAIDGGMPGSTSTWSRMPAAASTPGLARQGLARHGQGRREEDPVRRPCDLISGSPLAVHIRETSGLILEPGGSRGPMPPI